MTSGEPTHHAVRAALAVAEANGLRVGEPVVLRDMGNLLVHLRPAPVVARVATATAAVRPDVAEHFRRADQIADYLAGRGVPVVMPSRELPAGPHLHNGFVVGFAAHVEHDPDWRPGPAEFARLLARMHAELRDFPGALPTRMPLDDVDRILAQLPDPTLTAIRDELAARWTEHQADARPVHGDAHPGNLLRTANDLVWNDFEDTWHGPVAWDLACLANTGRIDGAAAVRHYPELPAEPDLAFHLAVRRLHAACWLMVLDRHR